MFLRRRRLIATTGLAAASLGLPRIAIGQADRRPSITIAVQQIANSASLEPLREQSNVGQRVFSFIYRAADHPEPAGQARGDAGPGGELEAYRRTHRRVHPAQGREVPQRRRDDGRRRGLHLQPRAHVRAGLRHHLEQDAVHLGADPRFGPGQGAAAGGARRRQAPVPRPREGRGDRQVHGALHQPHARRHPRRPHRPHGQRHRLAPRLRPGQELDGLVAGAGRRPAPTRCASSCPTSR